MSEFKVPSQDCSLKHNGAHLQEAQSKAPTSMHQRLDCTSRVPTKLALHQHQNPAFWVPGSCCNYCCQVADPQPTITGTEVKVQDMEGHLLTPWCLCTGRFSPKGCCLHCATREWHNKTAHRLCTKVLTALIQIKSQKQLKSRKVKVLVIKGHGTRIDSCLTVTHSNLNSPRE